MLICKSWKLQIADLEEKRFQITELKIGNLKFKRLTKLKVKS